MQYKDEEQRVNDPRFKDKALKDGFIRSISLIGSIGLDN
jgi:hypothetical protein